MLLIGQKWSIYLTCWPCSQHHLQTRWGGEPDNMVSSWLPPAACQQDMDYIRKQLRSYFPTYITDDPVEMELPWCLWPYKHTVHIWDSIGGLCYLFYAAAVKSKLTMRIPAWFETKAMQIIKDFSHPSIFPPPANGSAALRKDWEIQEGFLSSGHIPFFIF